MASSLLLLFLISNIATALSTTTTTTTTKIPLSKSPNHPSSSPPTTLQSLTLATTSSLHRARHLKRRPTTLTGTAKLPTYPRSYGGYSVHLSFGTPPQQTYLAFDTGSSLVWTPCTTPHTPYTCLNCSFSGVDPTTLPLYNPTNSSSARRVPCHAPQCASLFGSDSLNCTRRGQHCPDYELEYGLGATAGHLFSDALGLSNVSVPGFLFGCSLISERQPEGIAGFGRGQASLPVQLGLRKFSYCLVSHNFDDSPQSGELTLYSSHHRHGYNNGISYARFKKSPAISPYNEYYYVALSTIAIGGKIVRLPSRYLVASPKGNGGVIVDSGSTFTFMDSAIFKPVARELEKQMSRYKRAKDVEEESGLGPCYDITGEKDVEVPKMGIVFEGGAKMDLPLANYFSFVGGSSVVCMIVLTDPEGPTSPGVPSGPAMIIGNYQQQNYYVEYDLEKERFGFKPQQCDQAKH